jgi:hypothetical protein
MCVRVCHVVGVPELIHGVPQHVNAVKLCNFSHVGEDCQRDKLQILEIESYLAQWRRACYG